MTGAARLRLRSQRLAGARPSSPAEAVRWMGAVQAQDRAASLWAIGLRTRGARAEDVERDEARGRIVRTWPLRNTLHFVPAGDVRGLLALGGARALRRTAARRAELGLSPAVQARARRVLARALEREERLPRREAYAVLERAGVGTGGQRGFHLLGAWALEGLLVLGPPEGAQPTFVLLDAWLPPERAAPRPDEVLARLARRFFASHGPATARDLAWWAGLPMAQAREGLAAARRGLVETEGGWQARGARPASPGTAHLLPAFDELLVAYKDRSASLARLRPGRVPPATGLLSPVVVLDGQVAGLWGRAVRGGRVEVTVRPLAALGREEREGVAAAAQRYADFLGLELALRWGRVRIHALPAW